MGAATIHALCATFANVGYMGIPLCRMAFGEDSLVPSVITMVITACPQFGRGCTPDMPLGALMVSSEGACAAHYTYGRYRDA